MTRAAIALGSNLGDRYAALGNAVGHLAGLLGEAAVSDFVETRPEGVAEQPAFLNAAVSGEWAGDARSLFGLLMDLERAAGRQRPYPGAPRTLDLDLILFGSAIIDEPDLVVPHPRFRDRGFVLAPLAQIDPALVDPVSGRTIEELFRIWQEG